MKKIFIFIIILLSASNILLSQDEYSPHIIPDEIKINDEIKDDEILIKIAETTKIYEYTKAEKKLKLINKIELYRAKDLLHDNKMNDRFTFFFDNLNTAGKNKYQLKPTGFAFAMCFPGTFYTWNTFGGSAEENIRLPLAAHFNRNYLPEIIFTVFNKNSKEIPMAKSGENPNSNKEKKLNQIFYIDWGGDNRDISHKGTGRLDYLDKWCLDYIHYNETYKKDNSDDSIIVTGFSHGNQTCIEMLNKLAEYNLLNKNTIYISFSKPDREDHQLSKKVLNILGKNFINVYNIQDHVIRTSWYKASAATDLYLKYLDKDKKKLLNNRLSHPYDPDAINFMINNQNFHWWANHCASISRTIITEKILNFYMENYYFLKKGEIYHVYFFDKPINDVIILPEKISRSKYKTIYDFLNQKLKDPINKLNEKENKISKFKCFLDSYRFDIPDEIQFSYYCDVCKELNKKHKDLYKFYKFRHYLNYEYIYNKKISNNENEKNKLNDKLEKISNELFDNDEDSPIKIPINNSRLKYFYDYFPCSYMKLYQNYKGMIFFKMPKKNFNNFNMFKKYYYSDIIRFFLDGDPEFEDTIINNDVQNNKDVNNYDNLDNKGLINFKLYNNVWKTLTINNINYIEKDKKAKIHPLENNNNPDIDNDSTYQIKDYITLTDIKHILNNITDYEIFANNNNNIIKLLDILKEKETDLQKINEGIYKENDRIQTTFQIRELKRIIPSYTSSDLNFYINIKYEVFDKDIDNSIKNIIKIISKLENYMKDNILTEEEQKDIKILILKNMPVFYEILSYYKLKHLEECWDEIKYLLIVEDKK